MNLEHGFTEKGPGPFNRGEADGWYAEDVLFVVDGETYAADWRYDGMNEATSYVIYEVAGLESSAYVPGHDGPGMDKPIRGAIISTGWEILMGSVSGAKTVLHLALTGDFDGFARGTLARKEAS